MARTVEAESSQRTSQLPVRVRSRADPFLVICRCFSFLSAVMAIFCVFVNVLSAIRSFKKGSDIFGGIFRCYAVIIALLSQSLKQSGDSYSNFGGVAVMTRAFPDTREEGKNLMLLQEIASYLLLSCGICYLISGVLCMGFLKRSRLQREITRAQAARDLEDLEKRREELESLLLMETA